MSEPRASGRWRTFHLTPHWSLYYAPGRGRSRRGYEVLGNVARAWSLGPFVLMWWRDGKVRGKG